MKAFVNFTIGVLKLLMSKNHFIGNISGFFQIPGFHAFHKNYHHLICQHNGVNFDSLGGQLQFNLSAGRGIGIGRF